MNAELLETALERVREKHLMYTFEIDPVSLEESLGL